MDANPGLRQGHTTSHHMERHTVTTNGIHDIDFTTVPTDHTDVPGLPTTPGIENCAIEKEPVLGDIEHPSFRLDEIGIAGGELFDGSWSGHVVEATER
jgi:hypothetical protein